MFRGTQRYVSFWCGTIKRCIILGNKINLFEHKHHCLENMGQSFKINKRLAHSLCPYFRLQCNFSFMSFYCIQTTNHSSGGIRLFYLYETSHSSTVQMHSMVTC